MAKKCVILATINLNHLSDFCEQGGAGMGGWHWINLNDVPILEFTYIIFSVILLPSGGHTYVDSLNRYICSSRD